MEEHHSNKALLSRLKQNDRTAFEEVYHLYSDTLYANALKLTKNCTIAEDIVQEVYLRLWEKRHSLADNSTLSGWLFVVCYNKSVNHLKYILRKRKNSLPNDTAILISPDDEIEKQAAQAKMLDMALNNLSPQKRKVVELCKLQGKTYEEAATMLGISKHTVKEYLSDSVRDLKKIITNHSESSLLFTQFIFW